MVRQKNRPPVFPCLPPVFLSVTANLGALNNLSNIDINETFTGFVNNDPKNMTKTVKSVFDSDHYLLDEGDYFQVVVTVKDYGDVTTKSNDIICRWVLTASDEASDDIVNNDYVISAMWSSKVE